MEASQIEYMKSSESDFELNRTQDYINSFG